MNFKTSEKAKRFLAKILGYKPITIEELEKEKEKALRDYLKPCLIIVDNLIPIFNKLFLDANFSREYYLCKECEKKVKNNQQIMGFSHLNKVFCEHIDNTEFKRILKGDN